MAVGRYFETVFGRMYVAAEGGCVVRLTCEAAADGDVVVDKKETPALLERTISQVMEYLDGKRTDFDIPVQASGTPFQKKVWDALCKIPYGRTYTYREVAEAVGSPKGARAVGMACNRNPIMLLIPCHRVIGSTGKLVGFGGGLQMKEYLLELERKSKKPH